MKNPDQNQFQPQSQTQSIPQHLIKKVIIIENHLPKQMAPFQENLNKLNQSQDQNLAKDALNQFIQSNKSEKPNISQILAEQSKFDPFNNNYIKEMEQMVFNNQKKLSNLKGTVSDLKKRAIVMENKLDDVESTMKQSQRDQRKKKNRRTAAEIQKTYNVILYSVPTLIVKNSMDQRYH